MILSTPEENRTCMVKVVYFSNEPMSFTRDQEKQLLGLLLPKESPGGRLKDFLLKWYGPTLTILGVIGVLVTALAYFVKPDVAALKESVDGIHRDVARMDAALIKVDARIDTVFGQMVQRLLTTPTTPANSPKAKQDAFDRNIRKVPIVLAVARDSNVKIPRDELRTVGARLNELVKEQPELSPVAWETMAAVLNYNSEQVTPPNIEWRGPAPDVLPQGTPGLYGQTELKGAKYYVSPGLVPLKQGSTLLPLRTEGEVDRALEERGRTEWPQYGKLVGNDETTVVLDKLHARNYVFEHVRIVYGGGRTVLENVTFTDCTFELIKTSRTLEFSNLLLTENTFNFGI